MARGWPFSLLALSASLRVTVASFGIVMGPWANYLTEPTFRSSEINITVDVDRSALSPGYFFLTPYAGDFRFGSYGPQIFDEDGSLIYCGNDTSEVRAMDAHICDYLGEKGNHICYNDAAPIEQAGHSAGVVRFFDNTYTQVANDFGAAGHLRGPDIHELNTPDWGDGYSFMQDIYEKKSMNLSVYDGPEDGYVLDGCFQEIDMLTKGVIFEWCALDHIPIWHTYTYLHHPGQMNYSTPITANGTWNAPWDWMHFNAVSKNEEGDYVISARHLNTIFKIAGNNNVMGLAPGEIVWRLGGKFSDFEQDFNFSRQHNVRFVSTGKTETVISHFNNAYDGLAYSQKYSEGQLISLNNETMVATLLQRYIAPDKLLSPSQGSMQLLPNGNVLIGWGNRPWYSEFTRDAKLLYHAKFGGGVESFRAWKFPWTAHPKTQPKLLAYAHNESAPLHAYVSWNGATEVKAWQFHVSSSTAHGPWRTLAIVPKQGFETHVNFSAVAAAELVDDDEVSIERITAYPYIYATALSSSGAALSRSPVMHTFIPNATIATKQCNETSCFKPKWFTYDSDWSVGHEIKRSNNAGLWALGFLVLAIEVIAWFVLDVGCDWIMEAGDSWIGGMGRRRGSAWGAEKDGRLPIFSMQEKGASQDELGRYNDVPEQQPGQLSMYKGRPVLDRGNSGPSPQTGAGVPVKVTGLEF